MDLVDGPVEFVDTPKSTRMGQQKLEPALRVEEIDRPLPTQFVY